MEIDTGVLALLLLLGTVAGLDGTAACQFMVSRPLVAAVLAGLAAGSPERGAAVGLLLEAIQLSVVPVGAARFPESGPAAVVAGGAYAAVGGGPVVLVAALLAGLAWETLGGYSVHWLRTAHVRVASAPAGNALSALHLQRRHGFAILVDAVRAFALTLTGLLLAVALLRFTAAAPWSWPAAGTVAGWSYWVALALVLASVAKSFAARRAWLLSGVIGGLLVAWLK